MIVSKQSGLCAALAGFFLPVLVAGFPKEVVDWKQVPADPANKANSLRSAARDAMARATGFFTEKVSTCGGYLWSYTKDLKKRWGEGKATKTQIWVQPPGTPSVGQAFLRAYEATGDKRYLKAALSSGRALAWGQLRCGGWRYRIDFRGNSADSTPPRPGGSGTFDDNTTQSALSFMIALDQYTDDSRVAGSVRRGISYLKEAQFENGAWPQWYPLRGGYHDYYTFNDNAINDCIRVAWEAYEAYGREDCRAMALRGGDFIIDSQMDEPQAGWAQQYTHDMKPAPARWFEPASINGAATSNNIETLLDLYVKTGKKRFLKPVPRAIRWLERSQLSDGRWARFYEPGTNRPLYVNMDHEVVYEFENIRPGYSWRSTYGIPGNLARYRRLRKTGLEAYRKELKEQASRKPPAKQVRSVIDALDSRGRWLEGNRIETSLFIRNMGILARYVKAGKKSSG